MARTQIAIWFTLIVAMVADATAVHAQNPINPFANSTTNRPIINSFRQRATDNLVTDAFKNFSQNSKLSGKLCKKCAEKRNQRLQDAANDQELMKKAKEAAVEKLEQEAKKAKFEAKALEEADYEKHKPWDVAAPENLESPSPLLQAAAASKQDQDLAPKKIRALEYLAQLGCNKDPKVEAAILEGLKDHNPAVRWAAIQTVLATARGVSVSYEDHPFVDSVVPQQPENSMIDPLEFGLEQECYPAKKPSQIGGECEQEEPPKEEDPCEECQNCRKKRKPCLQRLKGLCKRCKGHGCQTCNFGGHAPEICEPCVPVDGCQACGVPVEMPSQECEPCKVHNGCITCCPSKKILAELKRIAFEPDRDREGCYYEPSIDLRNLALEALNVCPPLKDDTDNDNNNNKVPETGDTPEVDRSRPTEGIPGSGTDGTGSSVLDDQSSNRVNSFVPISHRRATPSSELMMTARVAKFYSNGFLIQFSEDYLIPVNKKLLIEMTDGRHAIVQVIKSDVGVAQVMPTDGQIFRTASPTLYVGVIDE